MLQIRHGGQSQDPVAHRWVLAEPDAITSQQTFLAGASSRVDYRSILQSVCKVTLQTVKCFANVKNTRSRRASKALPVTGRKSRVKTENEEPHDVMDRHFYKSLEPTRTDLSSGI